MIDHLLDAVSRDHDAERAGLEQEREQLRREIDNLTKGIALGGNIDTLAAALKERDARLKTLDAPLAKPVMLPNRDAMEASLMRRTAEWRDVLRGPHVQQARVVLQHLVDLPLRVFNDPQPKWMTTARPEGLMVGLVQSVASPRGTDRFFTMELRRSLRAA